MSKKQNKNSVDKFIIKITEIKEQYQNTKSIEELTKSLHILAEEYGNFVGVGDYLLNWGEEHIANGNYQAGIVFIKTVDEYFSYIANTTLLNLRMAEYHIENNETEIGTQYLIKLCTAISNYEESIEFNELTAVWEKYKHLVKDKIPASVAFNSCGNPLKPEDCSMKIDEIFSLPHSEILDKISTHLGELSANGDSIDSLNEVEKIVFYIDELCMEVNSGGFEGYLYYYGHHFKNAYKALETIKAVKMSSIMESLQSKFPKGKIPKSLDSIQKTMDSLEEIGIDFEEEDTKFYDTEEKILLDILFKFAFANKKYFR